MAKEAIKEGFQEMGLADRLVIDAVNRMREANVDPSFAIVSMFHFGVVNSLTDLDCDIERRHVLDHIDNYVRNAREVLDIPVHQSFLD